MKPACYPTQKLYNEWQRCAILAREACSPCTDCNRSYAADMRDQQKCEPLHVKATFRVLTGKPEDPQAFSPPGE